MKKKGLIVATIVMVLVLAVSLTTATYAWFSNSAAVSIKELDVKVASASNISLGILKNGGTVTDPTSYIYGNILYAENDSTPGLGAGIFYSNSALAATPSETEDLYPGLGSSINWDWSLSSAGGVSSSQDKTNFDANYTASNPLCTGSLHGTDTTPTLDGVATFNKATTTGENAVTCTVIYAPFGVRVEKAGLNYLYCDIEVTAKSAAFWGIVTALKLEITSGTTVKYSGHPFDSNATGHDGLLATAKNYNSTTGAANTKQIFRFIIAHDSTELDYADQATINSFKIRMFIDGKNTNCIADATQYNAQIKIKFDAVTTAAYALLDSAAVEDLTA